MSRLLKLQFPLDYIDGDSFVKLYVAGIPRTATEQDVSFIKSLFVSFHFPWPTLVGRLVHVSFVIFIDCLI